MVTTEHLRSIVETEVARLGLDERFIAHLMEIVKYESYPTSINGHPGYELDDDGTYRGLYQFSRYSWNLMLDAYPTIMEGMGFEHVLEVRASVLATIAYLTDSRKVHKNRYGEEILDDFKLVYLYHQQGASYARTFLRTGELVRAVQSDKSKALFKEINRGKYNV